MTNRPDTATTTVGAYDARTRFSELVARAERGESFIVTKNGRPVARITPVNDLERGGARQAAQRLRALLAGQGPPISEQEAQRNWEELKRELDREDDLRMDRWLSS
jgi:prevent-host-death family protein